MVYVVGWGPHLIRLCIFCCPVTIHWQMVSIKQLNSMPSFWLFSERVHICLFLMGFAVSLGLPSCNNCVRSRCTLVTLDISVSQRDPVVERCLNSLQTGGDFFWLLSRVPVLQNSVKFLEGCLTIRSPESSYERFRHGASRMPSHNFWQFALWLPKMKSIETKTEMQSSNC